MDPPEHNEGMVEKLALPFPLKSDAKGDLAERCGLWDDIGVAVLTIVVADTGGVVRYVYAEHDFADVWGDEEVFGALDGVANADAAERNADGPVKIQASFHEAAASSVRPYKPPMALEQLVPCYRGSSSPPSP